MLKQQTEGDDIDGKGDVGDVDDGESEAEAIVDDVEEWHKRGGLELGQARL